MNWFFNYIKRLQERSVPERDKYALAGAIVITIIIFLIWLSTYGLLDRKNNLPNNSPEVDLSPIKNMKSALGDIWSVVKGLTGVINQAQNTSTSTAKNATETAIIFEENSVKN